MYSSTTPVAFAEQEMRPIGEVPERRLDRVFRGQPSLTAFGVEPGQLAAGHAGARAGKRFDWSNISSGRWVSAFVDWHPQAYCQHKHAVVWG